MGNPYYQIESNPSAPFPLVNQNGVVRLQIVAWENIKGLLTIILPDGKSNEELLVLLREDMKHLIENDQTYGKDIKITGRITTHLAMYLGHCLAHVSKSVSLFDPKENIFVSIIQH